METELSLLQRENGALKATVAILEARLQELERRLGLNSGNSGKPPSSDGLARPVRTGSLRESTGKLSGGQVGHKGETLSMVAVADVVVEHRASHCGGCGVSLHEVAASVVEKRQLFDIPVPVVAVTEHRALTLCCPSCGLRNKGEFPGTVRAPVQYGNRFRAAMVYLSAVQLIPEDRLAQLSADLFGLPVATATLGAINAGAAARLAPMQEAALAELKAAPVKHLDETGFRVGGKTRWLHVIGNQTATHYRVSEKRGNLLTGVSGVTVHDHWKPYFTMQGVTHALCNAHILRELKALIEIEKENWARHLQRLLRLLCRINDPPMEKIHRIYDRIIATGIAFHEAQKPLSTRKNKRRIGHNLLLRLKNFKEAVLRFLTNPLVPFTNNQAEQDIRMMKVKQKISGAFRTDKGADNFCVLRGFLSTQRKSGANPFTILEQQLA